MDNNQQFNGKLKQKQICAHLEWSNYDLSIWKMYIDDMMSGIEIADYINQNTPQWLSITPKSIQRRIVMIGKSKGILRATRSTKEAFNNAIKRNRVQWAYKSHKIRRVKLNPKLRYRILERDGFKCVLCGATADTALLEVDHIIPVRDKGTSEDSNLRTLCYECNFGKG